jgi:hypothetical protein
VVKTRETGEIMSKVSLKGVLVGGITDVGATIILGVPLALIFVVAKVDFVHMPKDQVQAAVAAAIHGNTFLYAVQVLIGAACSVLGGYVAARIAKHDELLNGALSSFLCIGMGLYSVVGGKDSSSLPVQLLLLLASPVLGLLGGYLGLKYLRARGLAARGPEL